MNAEQSISPEEQLWRLELIRRLSWGQLIDHIVINHLWRGQCGTSPADLYSIPTVRHA